MSPTDIDFSPTTMVQPDVFVVPAFQRRTPRSWKEVKALLLAVEVISPSSPRSDRTTKRLLVQRERVPEYWIVDLDARVIERWGPVDERPEVLSELLQWQPSHEHDALSIDLPRYFEDVLGE